MKNQLCKLQLNQSLKLFYLLVFFIFLNEKLSAQIKTDFTKDSIKQKTDSLLLANGWYPNQESYDIINSKFHCGNNQDSIFCAAQSFFSNPSIINEINQNNVDRDYEKALKLKNKMARELNNNCHTTDENIKKFLSANQLLQFNNEIVKDSVRSELDLLRQAMVHLSKLINKMWDDTLTISGNTTELLNDDMLEMNSAFSELKDTISNSDLANLLIIKIYTEEVIGILQQAIKNSQIKIGFSGSHKINYYSSLCNFTPPDNYPKAVTQNKSENELMVNVRTIDSTTASKDGYYAFYLPRSAYVLKKFDKTQRFSKTTCQALEPFAFGARYYLWIEDRNKKILAPAQEFEIKANDRIFETDKTPMMTIQVMIK